MLRHLFRRLFSHPHERRALADQVREKLRHSYPHPEARALPRGTISRIAREVGCSQGHASKIAKKLGYHTEGTP